MQTQCPLNRFKPCIGARCGMSIEKGKREFVCSLQFIGHELFVLADIAMQNSSTGNQNTTHSLQSTDSEVKR